MAFPEVKPLDTLERAPEAPLANGWLKLGSEGSSGEIIEEGGRRFWTRATGGTAGAFWVKNEMGPNPGISAAVQAAGKLFLWLGIPPAQATGPNSKLNAYRASWTNTTGGFKAQKFQNGGATTIFEVTLLEAAVSPGDTLGFSVSGTTAALWHNGVELGSSSGASLPSVGYVGIGTVENSTLHLTTVSAGPVFPTARGTGVVAPTSRPGTTAPASLAGRVNPQSEGGEDAR